MMRAAGESFRNINDGNENIKKNMDVITNVNLILNKLDGSIPPLTKGYTISRMTKPPRYPIENPNPDTIPVFFSEES